MFNEAFALRQLKKLTTMKNLSKSELNAIMGGPSRRTDADKCPNYSVNPNKKTLFPIISGILTK